MNRPTRAQMWMAMARAAATRSTCYRLNVGAVAVNAVTHAVAAVGYNGAPRGQPHCSGNGCQYFQPTGCTVLHAEQNVAAQLTLGHHELYVTHSPCGKCAEMILACRLFTRVYYETAYRDPTPVKTLIDGGLSVYQLLPSGFVVDAATGELCHV